MSKIIMTHSVIGEDNADGTSSRKYLIGEELPTSKKWQKALAQNMIERGAAIEVQGNQDVMTAAPDVGSPTLTEIPAKKKRGRPPKNKGA